MQWADDKIALYQVLEDSEDLFDEFNITEYPTPILFINGERLDYKGPRFEYDMFNWLQRVLNPTNNILTKSTELRIVQEMKVAIVLFAVEGENDREAQKMIHRFNLLRLKYDKFPMVYSYSSKLAREANITTKYGLVVYRIFEEGQQTYQKNEPLTEEEIVKFIEVMHEPSLKLMDTERMEEFFQNKNPAMIFLSDNLDF